MATILVTGSNGQVGSELQYLAKNKSEHQWIWTDIAELDITNENSVTSFFQKHQPDYVINSAAYTAVDKAEEQEELCEKINVRGPELLAKSCLAHNATMIQISSDYVYDNNENRPLIESDATAPKSVYARTKLAGDEVTMSMGKNIVIRTSWVYSSFGHNFVKTMKRLGSERPALSVVDDQIGTPTYARDLAKVLIGLVDHDLNSSNNKLTGVYHYSNEGVCSWYDFALAIFEEEKLDCNLKPIPSSEYPTPAARPTFSVLNKNKIKRDLGIKIPHWREALRQCLVEINRSV